jgi:uncharacterized protein (DUF2252 family)
MAAAIAPFATDLVALESSVDRAGRALGCTYATSEEFEAAFVAARRRQGAFTRPFQPARFVLMATAATSMAALVLLALR